MSQSDQVFPVWLIRLGLAALGCFIVLHFLTPAAAVSDPTLDTSNYVSYAFFTDRGLAYGEEVMPMVGPYGFILYGHTYGGDLFWSRLGLELVVKLTLAGLMLGFMSRIPSRLLRWGWLVAGLILLPSVHDALYSITVLLAGLHLLRPSATDRLSRLIRWHLLAVIALLVLSKGTLLSLGILVIAMVVAKALWAREFRDASILAGGFTALLVAWWLLAGQPLLNLPAHVFAILDISAGYNQSMGLAEPPRAFWIGLLGMAALGILLGLRLSSRDRWNSESVATTLLLTAYVLVSWKHGFLRADGHVFLFYRQTGFLAVTLLALSRIDTILTGWRGWFLVYASTLGVAACVLGDGHGVVARWQWELGQLPSLAPRHLHHLATAAAQKERLEERLAEQRHQYRLPRTVAKWGDEPVDFFGIEHGYTLLNGLNYRPRPMGGGSYGAFTPHLQEINARFVADANRAPTHYLVQMGTIDNRFVAQDDGQTLLELLHHYRPMDVEQTLLMFERIDAGPRPPPTPVSRAPVVSGEWIQLPGIHHDQMLLMSLQVDPTLMGRLRGFLYRPPILFATFDGNGLENESYRRILPHLMKDPVLLAPFIESNQDVLDLYSPGQGKPLARIRFDALEPGLWDWANAEVKFHVTSRPQMAPADWEDLRMKWEHPLIHPVPQSREPANGALRRFAGLPVRMLDAPGEVVFDLSGDERVLEFAGGLDDAAWQEGESDGIAFLVDVRDVAGNAQTVFRRDIRPNLNPADAGLQEMAVPLPVKIPAGGSLALRSDPGPDGNGAWDWSYITRVNLLAGPLDRRQFPGFSQAPTVFTGEHCGVMELEGHSLVLLNAPGSLEFEVDSTVQRISFDAGLVPGAYLEGETDGADFVVEWILLSGEVGEVGRRSLAPRTNEEDRGMVPVSFALSSPELGARLRVRTDPGPADSNAWDWTYLHQLIIE